MKIISGAIRYISHKPEMYGKTRGHERFSFMQHENGDISLTAHCLIFEPAPTVERSVYYRVTKDRKPIEATVNVRSGTRDLGTAYYRFANDAIHYVTADGDHLGEINKVDIPNPLRWFGTHPISADSFNIAGKQAEFAANKTNLLHSFLTGTDVRGEAKPGVDNRYINCDYVGKEIVELKGKTYSTHRFRLYGRPGDHDSHPDYNLWVTDDEIGILVKADCGGHMMTYYEIDDIQVFTK